MKVGVKVKVEIKNVKVKLAIKVHASVKIPKKEIQESKRICRKPTTVVAGR